VAAATPPSALWKPMRPDSCPRTKLGMVSHAELAVLADRGH
jgi:hypothetical protein